jgi:IMP dehydrogenase
MTTIPQGLTFDDVLLIPAYSSVLPREVKLATKLTSKILLNIPLVSAAMDTVTESRLAIALAEEGGLGILHKNMSIDEQVAEVKKVKRFENGIINDPITVTPDTTLEELFRLTRMHGISGGMPVVKGDKLVGIITNRDVRFEANLSQSVKKLMTPADRLITAKDGCSREEIVELMHRHRVEKILIVDSDFHLRGLVTAKDILSSRENPNACRDSSGRLRVGAAVSTDAEVDVRVKSLINADSM